MKYAILLLTLLSLCLPASAQFRRSSDNGIYPYNTNLLLSSDVFIIGRPGVTNYNYAYSNLNRLNITNVTIVNSNSYSTNIITTNLYAGNIYATNLFVTNFFPTYTTNLYITNLQAGDIYTTNLYATNIYNNTFNGRTTITSNLYATNIITTNLFAGDTYISNAFVTNLFAGNTYVTNLITTNLFSSNAFFTNIFSTNAYITNLFSTTQVTSNLYTTNLYTTNLFAGSTYISNSFVTNLFATNAYITNLYTSNLFATNLFTTNAYITNLYSSNIFTTNLFSTNAYITNLFSTTQVTSNLFTTNLYTTNLFSSNIYTTNITANFTYTTNLFAGDTYTTNLYVTNITISGNIIGISTNDIFCYNLSNAAAIGATSISLDRSFIPPATPSGHIAIGFGRTNCEIRPSKSVSGNAVSWDRTLTFPHAAGERVVWFSGDTVDLAWWGAFPDSGVDVAYSFVNALYESGQEALWLDGSMQAYYTTLPLVASPGGRIKSISINAKTGYTGVGHTNSFLLWNSQGLRVTFSADAGTDVITTSSNWSPPPDATNSVVVFYGLGGTNLPAPLSNGVPYYVKAYSGTTMMVGLSTNLSEVINITATGTGFAMTEVGSLERLYLTDVTVNGQGIAPNGIFAAMQQPAYWSGYVRADSFINTGVKFTGQDMFVNRLQVASVGVGLDLRKGHGQSSGMQFLEILDYNAEIYTNAILVGGNNNVIHTLHLETPQSSTAADLDATYETSGIIIHNPYVSKGTKTNTFLKAGVSGGVFCNYDIDNGFISAVFDSDTLMLDDQYRHRQIFAYKTTTGALRSFGKLQSMSIPDSNTYVDLWSGNSVIGPDGRAFQYGLYYGPLVRFQAGTNDFNDLSQWLRWDNTTNSGFNLNGDFFTKTNAGAGRVLHSDASGNAKWDLVNQTLTNTNPRVPDFALPVNYWVENAAFLFLPATGVDTTGKKFQVTDVIVTNSTAAAVAVTFPGTIRVTGTAFLTNVTKFHFSTFAGFWTNCACEPIW